MKILKEILSIITWVIIMLLTIICFVLIYLILCSKFNFNKLPNYSIYTIASTSMENTINKYDVIIVKKSEVNDIAIGDIITYKSNHRYVTHRVKTIIDGKYKTKGDNNITYDKETVLYKDVKGKVVFIIPLIGYITLLFSYKYLWICIVVFLVLLTLLTLGRKKKNGLSKNKK